MNQLSLFTLLPKVGEGRPVRPASENLSGGPHAEAVSVPSDDLRPAVTNLSAQNTSSEQGSGIPAGETRADTPQPKDICAKYHKSNPFSVAAGQKAAKGAEKAKSLILLTLKLSPNGATCENLEDRTGLSHQSCSARISEAVRDGLIERVGKAKTRSGCWAAIYKVKE